MSDSTWFAERRRAAGFARQQDLARALGTSQPQVSAMETSGRVGVDFVVAVAEALKMPVDEVVALSAQGRRGRRRSAAAQDSTAEVRAEVEAIRVELGEELAGMEQRLSELRLAFDDHVEMHGRARQQARRAALDREAQRRARDDVTRG